MKRCTALFVLLMAVIISEASHRNSGMEISLWGNADYTIEVNGHRYQACGPVFEIGELPAGHHRVKVTSYRQGRGYGNRPHRRVIFNGYIDTRPFHLTQAVVRNNHRLLIQGYIPLQPAPVASYIPIGMPHGQYASLMHQLQALNFDSERIRLVQEIFRYHDFTALQVKGILATFTFDRYRVDAAKWAFHRTIDQSNFYLIMDVFDFRSSANEVYAYINGQ